jgi:hypothetical protein
LERVSGARAVEQALQLDRVQRLVEARAAFPRGHGEPVMAFLQRVQHLQDAREQRQVVLARQVVEAVALHHLRDLLLRDLRHRMRHGAVQAQADDP